MRIAFVLPILLACKALPPEPPVTEIEAGSRVTTGICSLIEGIDDDGTVRTICATIEEIAQIATFVLTLRAIDAGSSTTCAPLPGSAVCATKPEIAKAVLYLAQRRQSRFMVNEGVP